MITYWRSENIFQSQHPMVTFKNKLFKEKDKGFVLSVDEQQEDVRSVMTTQKSLVNEVFFDYPDS